MKHRAGLLKPSQGLLLALQCLEPVSSRRSVHFGLPRNQVQPTIQESSPFVKWLAEHPRDQEIDTRFVQVKQRDGSINEPTPLLQVLSQLDPRTQTLLQLSKPGTQPHAVVEVTALQQLRERFRAEQEAAKQVQQAQRERKPKQLELNWAISEHDLELKLKQLEQFLERGKRVEVLLASKKKQRRAELSEAELLLQKLRNKLVDIDAKEIAPMEGRVLGQAMIVVQKRVKA